VPYVVYHEWQKVEDVETLQSARIAHWVLTGTEQTTVLVVSERSESNHFSDERKRVVRGDQTSITSPRTYQIRPSLERNLD